MSCARGFTLLEVLIGLVISSAVLIVLSQGARSALDLAHSADRLDQALSRARSHLVSAERSSLVPGQQSGDDGGGYRWRITTRPEATALPGLIAADAKTTRLTLFSVTATISWGDGAAGHVISLTTQAIGPAPDQPP